MPSSLLQAGTNGWLTIPAIAKHRLGILGPNGDPNKAPYTIRVIRRTAGDHKGYLTFMEYDQSRVGHEWMIMVLDSDRNLVGQVLRHTRDAARRAMNEVFASKGLGTFSHRSSDDA
jgi:hypothetical protein